MSVLSQTPAEHSVATCNVPTMTLSMKLGPADRRCRACTIRRRPLLPSPVVNSREPTSAHRCLEPRSCSQSWAAAQITTSAIRSVANRVIKHLHDLDLGFHLSRQTGALNRIMDRGTRGINFILTSMVFNVVPTALEVTLVAGERSRLLPAPHSCAVAKWQQTLSGGGIRQPRARLDP